MHTNLPARFPVRIARVLAALALTLGLGGAAEAATTKLSNLPTYSASNVPANLMLALSVEYPTGTVAAYTNTTFSTTATYLGYFDNTKCYSYSTGQLDGASDAGYFFPAGTKGTSSCNTGKTWSGNFLNWVSMTALDEFRQSLTGGNRSYDTAGKTLLRRSNLNSQSTAGNFPDRSANSGTTDVPTAAAGGTVATAVTFRSWALNNTFQASRKNSNGDVVQTVTYNVQVQVCVDASTAEANCTAYGSNFKPEGLIQQNFDRIRVGASAYAYSDGSTRPNGLVRALLRDNGPTTYNGNGARQPNPNTEWDKDTGVFRSNPASGDSTYNPMTTFTKSGVINYLNQFGDNGYELYDTISDLYWATLAYMQQTPLNSDYSGGTVDLDKAFPSFKGTSFGASGTVNDPIQYSCQANAIVVIGDSHTHCDARVPTSGTLPAASGTCKAMTPLLPADNGGVDAKTYLDKMGGLPLLEKNGTTAASSTLTTYLGKSPSAMYEPNNTNSPTYNIAGLAYYAHTKDIRPQLDTNGKELLTGTQTVDTYVVDVLEPGFYDGTSGHEFYNPAKVASGGGPNAYWLAAKYGGFTNSNNDGVPASQLTWHTNTSTSTALRPDNYFPGNRPDLIQSGLAQIFSHVSSTKSLSASGPSVSPTRVLTSIVAGTAPYNSASASGFPIYSSSYVPGVWTGDVLGQLATAAIGTDVTFVANVGWSAQVQLDALTQAVDSSNAVVGWDKARKVITYNGSNKGTAFRYGSLTTTQQGQLPQELVNYLRGDRSKEGVNYNIRTHILGDIVDSQPTLVQAALSPQYRDSVNPGYSTFVTNNKLRQPMVYVGANDGMMHAFAADFSVGTTNPFSGGGNERYAYVPSLLFAGPSGTPLVDGLAALGNLNGVSANSYGHHFYVNQTPQAADVDLTRTTSTPGKDGKMSSIPSTSSNWHTLLVGGLGKGGKGIYALDVTTPPAAPALGTASTTTAETALATSIVKWEFTDSTMGFTYGRPLVVKTRRYGWVVAVTSGYNNSDGIGYLYIIDANSGVLLDKMSTGVGTATTPSGLGRPAGFTQDVSDNTVDQIYAGDLLGNVWRFDVSGTGDGKYPAPVLLATLTDPSNNPQPITTAPRIELSFDSTGQGTRRWVFVGTGRYLDSSDLVDTQKQTMYALRDGTALAPSTPATALTRSDLKKNDLVTGLILGDGDNGWYYDLTGTAPGTGGAAERIVVDPDAVAGIFSVAWATLIPTADPCSLAGAIYSANFDTGKSTLLDTNGNPLTSVATNTATTSLQLVQLPNGTFVILYGQTGQAPATSNLVQPGTGPDILRTNWREILN